MADPRPTRWRVFQGGLSGRYYCALSSERGDGVWKVIGKKHDVTEDIEALINPHSKSEPTERDGGQPE